VSYILFKQYSALQARMSLLKFKTLVTVLAVNDKKVKLALSSNFTDFKDALQYYSAIENGVKVLLTGNLKDYKPAEIAIMTADQFAKSN